SADFIPSHIESLYANNLLLLVTGGFFLLFPLFYFLVRLSGQRKESMLKYNTSEGEIIISILAVEDFIKKVARSFREVKDVSPTISLRGNDGLSISLKIKIWSGVQNLPVALEEIQKEIRCQIQDMLGIEHIYGITVIIAKDSFVQRNTPARQRSISSKQIQQEEVESTAATYNDLDNDYNA
ncbi:hypothetical protein KDK77_10740, partial [bacterium]|nr:hypothetical protein [bacterium]